MLRLYIFGAVGVAFLGLAGFAWWQSGRIDTLKLGKASLEAGLKTCNARVANITEDNQSDLEIDNLDDLRTVPDGWLLP